MESGHLKIALKHLGLFIAAFVRRKKHLWLKAGSLSFLVHLLVMPVVFFFVLRFEKPPADKQPVFMLSGGLQIKTVKDEPAETLIDELLGLDDEEEDELFDDEDLEDLEDDDEDMDLEREVLKRLAEEREDIFSIPARKSPEISLYELDDEEDEEEDELELLDELAEEIVDEEDVDELEGEVGDEEDEEDDMGSTLAGAGDKAKEGDGEKDEKDPVEAAAPPGKPGHWQNIFAGKVMGKKAQDGGGPESKGESAEKTEAKINEKIEEIMEANPYSAGGEPEAAGQPSVAGSFFGEGEDQLPDLLVWLPPDIKLAGLISLSMLRSRPDKEIFEGSFEKMPYFDSIAGGSDLDFFQQIDSVLIATKDPFDITETYLMLRHNQDEKMIRKAVSRHFRSFGIKENWYRISGRDVVQPSKKQFNKLPWVYFFPRDKIVGVVHISKRDSIKTMIDSTSNESGNGVHLIGPLERLLRLGYGMPAGAQEDGRTIPPAVVAGSVEFDKIMAQMNKGKNFPLPVEAMVIGRFGQSIVSVEGAARFENDQDPQKFIAMWNEKLEPIRNHKLIKMLGINKLIDFAVWKEGQDKHLTLEGLLPPERMEPLLTLIRLLTGGKIEIETKKTIPKPPDKPKKKN
ncbi:MAG: hypothetical protein ABIJ56_05205 [Pseudomonadota bacterium]